MTRTLPFTDNRYFEKVYIGVIIGGNMLHQNTARSRDDRAKEATIIRGLKALSVEAPTAVDSGLRALKPDGGTLTLDQKQFDLLKQYLEAAPFPTQDSDLVDEVIDWVSGTVEDKVAS